MPQPEPEVTRLYLARTEALATTAGDMMAEAWDDLGSWTDDDVDRLEIAAGPGIEVVSLEAAATSAAYLALLLDEPPVAATATVPSDWRGPFTWFWRALGQGRPFEEALASGRSRATASGHRAVTSTARRTGQLVGDRVTGWRRSLAGDSCQWCITVAGRTYATAESADFGHDNCNCGVTPILT